MAPTIMPNTRPAASPCQINGDVVALKIGLDHLRIQVVDSRIDLDRLSYCFPPPVVVMLVVSSLHF